MTVKESKNFFHLVGIVMRRRGICDGFLESAHTKRNVWLGQAKTLAAVSTDSSDRNL